MAGAIRSDRCEHFWAEVINVRGQSMARTMAALRNANFHAEAERLQGVCGTGRKIDWEAYARATFLAHTQCIAPKTLRFLQCVTPGTRDWWKSYENRGAVLLGSAAANGEAKPTMRTLL
jgi:hypothetical protein